MSRRPGFQYQKVLVQHWRWLEANGYKQQAASCKQQAASHKPQAASLTGPGSYDINRIIKEK